MDIIIGVRTISPLSSQRSVKPVGEPQRKLRDGERRCCVTARAEYGRSRDIKIFKAPDATIPIDDAVFGSAAHPGSPHLVTGRPTSRTERSPTLQGVRRRQNHRIDVQATNLSVDEIATKFERGLAHCNAIIV